MSFDAILFDLDDTLHDRAASLRAFTADQHRRWFDDRVGQEHFIQRFLALDANGHRSKAELYPALLLELDETSLEPAILLAEYDQRYHDFAVTRTGADQTLRELRSRGVLIGLVSNGWTDFQKRTIVASGLEDCFDAILISEAEGQRKPDKQIFERAARRLNVSPTDCLFVGDNPWADIDGARGAGMHTAWIPGGFAWPEGLARADWDLMRLEDLLGLARR